MPLEHPIQKSSRLQVYALIVAGLAVLISFPGIGACSLSREFLKTYMENLGSPIHLCLWAVLCFYVYAWVRSVRFGREAVFITLFFLMITSGITVDFDSLKMPAEFPFAMYMGIQMLLAITRKQSWRFSAALVAAIVGVTIKWGDGWEYVNLFLIHGIFLTLLLTGVFFKDWFALGLRGVAGVSLPLVLLLSFQQDFFTNTGISLYMISLGFILGLALTDAFLMFGSICCLVISGFYTGAVVLEFVRSMNLKGIIPILSGCLFFAAALFISLLKGGVIQKLPGMRNAFPMLNRRCGLVRKGFSEHRNKFKYMIVLFCLVTIAGMLMLSFDHGGRVRARQIQSRNNMKYIIIGIISYSDNDLKSSLMPYDPEGYEYALYKLLNEHVSDVCVFTSPLNPHEARIDHNRKCIENSSYVYLNKKGIKYTSRANICIIAENRFGKGTEGGNIGFLDGIVRYVRDPYYRPGKYLGKTYEEIFSNNQK